MQYPEFQESFAKEIFRAHARRFAVIQSLIREAQTNLEAGTCLLARGSLARGDFCHYSDVDLILLVPSQKHERLNITEQLRSKVQYPISFQTWLPSTPSERLKSLHIWFSVSQCCYIAGDIELFRNSQFSWLELLVSLNGNFLRDIYDLDPKRHQGMRNRSSLFSYNVKRGRGGIVDYEFSRLISLWLELKNIYSPLQLSLINLSQRCFKYLFLLKSYLHEVFECSCESSARLLELKGNTGVPYIFSQQHIVEMQEQHSRIIGALKQTLTGD